MLVDVVGVNEVETWKGSNRSESSQSGASGKEEVGRLFPL